MIPGTIDAMAARIEYYLGMDGVIVDSGKLLAAVAAAAEGPVPCGKTPDPPGFRNKAAANGWDQAITGVVKPLGAPSAGNPSNKCPAHYRGDKTALRAAQDEE